MTDDARADNRAGSAPRYFEPPAFRWRKFDPIGWWVRPEWEEILLGVSGLRLQEWRTAGILEEVKRNPQRVVYHVRHPQKAFYIKHFLIPGRRELLRQWLRRGKGRNEGRRAAQLEAIGVPTIRPIALGEERYRGFLYENYLISEEIPDSLPLDRFLDERVASMSPREGSRVRRDVAGALGRLTARLHRAGLVHNDYHAGNVLARVDPDGKLVLAMIDLDALRQKRWMGKRERRLNLAHLNHSFWFRSTRSERLRFLRAYLAEYGEAAGRKEWAKAIEGQTRCWAERLWRRWGKRCTGTNKYFRVLRDGRVWAVASRSLEPEQIRAVMRDPDAPFRGSSGRPLKESRTTSVIELDWHLDGMVSPVIYKRFNPKKRLERLWTFLRPSRGWRSWRAGHHLASRGLPTPENLLIVGSGAMHGGLGPATTTYLATRKVEPSMTLGEVFREVLPGLDEGTRRQVARRLADRLARLVRSLHERSISDRDLKVSNILLAGDPLAERPELCVIDLAGARPLHPLPRSRRLQNVSRVLVSLEELPDWNRAASFRFVRTYLGSCSTAEIRRWWAELRRLGESKRNRNRSRGRVIS